MKVLGISGSPRAHGNTEIAVLSALELLEKQGFETQHISLAEKPILHCEACNGCVQGPMPKCIQKQRAYRPFFEAVKQADGLLLGTPVYFGAPTPQMLGFMGCMTYISRRTEENFLRRKVGAAIAVGRRAGHPSALSQLYHLILRAEMVVAGAEYWGMAFGREKGEVLRDKEGMRSIEAVAENMGWLLKELAHETAEHDHAPFGSQNGDGLLQRLVNTWDYVPESIKVSIAQTLIEHPPSDAEVADAAEETAESA